MFLYNREAHAAGNTLETLRAVGPSSFGHARELDLQLPTPKWF